MLKKIIRKIERRYMSYEQRHNIDTHTDSRIYNCNKGKKFKLKTCSRARKEGSNEPFVYDLEF